MFAFVWETDTATNRIMTDNDCSDILFTVAFERIKSEARFLRLYRITCFYACSTFPRFPKSLSFTTYQVRVSVKILSLRFS